MRQLAGLLQTGDFIHPMALSGDTYARIFYPGTTDRSAARPVFRQRFARVTGRLAAVTQWTARLRSPGG